ncbi:aspartate kinase [Thermanaerothrix sp.]|jgi:aspartokinase/homoserine dehydrogenase 1|uniref:aspartate kinase n=1 Tax=Thermanaerothrix sp. TaxID=2972675 RepID=UPI002ADD83D7|nr:aspartate kinase [Thermanaerothrix sp.]
MSVHTHSRGLLVMKFGGTSVGDVTAVQHVLNIVHEARTTWPAMVVVASALSGVTETLLTQAYKVAQGDDSEVETTLQYLHERHHQLLTAFVSDRKMQQAVGEEIERLLQRLASLWQAIAVLGEASPRALDAVAGMGERMSVRVLAAALNTAGIRAEAIDATEIIVTDRQFQSAHPDMAATQLKVNTLLRPRLADGIVPVITGYIGATPEGIPTTLGRGGSDYSAAILAAALHADEVWIWTDVNGVMTADPRLIPEAQTIPRLTYREVAELAYFGAKVLHPKTIRPIIEAGIRLRVLNTFNPSHPGSEIVGDEPSILDGVIKAVTAVRHQRLVTVEGRGMLGVPGVAARTFTAVARTGTSVPLISQASSEQSICFAVPADTADKIVAALEQEFAKEIERRDIDRVWASDEVVILTVVGSGMQHIPGVAGRVFGALGAQGVNVIAIAQGSSEVSISLVVKAEDLQVGLRALHGLIRI